MSKSRKKMLKILISCIGISLLAILPIRWGLDAFATRNWQTIEIEDVSSLRVPGDWVFTERDGIMYFTDREFSDDDTLEDVTLYMFLLSPHMKSWIEGRGYIGSNTFFENVRLVREIDRNLVYFPIILGSPIGEYGDNEFETS